MTRRVKLVSASLLAGVLLASLTFTSAAGRDPEGRPMLGKGTTAQTGATIEAAAAPTGFDDRTVLTGLVHPTVIQFAGDGSIFVAEKRGTIKVFDSLTDTTPV